MSSEEYFENQRKNMVNSMMNKGILKNDRLIQALLKVPREKFIPAAIKRYAYADTRLPVFGLGQAISSPRTIVIVTEALNPLLGNKVLEIGTGSGYHAALISEIVRAAGAHGHVYSMEIVPELADLAQQNLREAGYSDRVTVIQGDGFEGYAENAPYDRIFSTASTPAIPKLLVDQLEINGVLVCLLQDAIPMSRLESLCVLKKLDNGEIQTDFIKL